MKRENLENKKENKFSKNFFSNKINKRENTMKKIINSEIVKEIAEIAEKENFEFNSKFDFSSCSIYSTNRQSISDLPIYFVREKNTNTLFTIKFVNKVFQLKEEILKIGIKNIIEKYKIVE